MLVGDPDVAIVGGGIAGSSLALVLARSGLQVLVLERQAEYRDRVRGEYLANWGVLEARDLGLEDLFRSAGSATARYRVPYDELTPREAAEAGVVDTATLLPGVEGGLCASHPATCAAVSEAASGAGAELIRGVGSVEVEAGRRPALSFRNGRARRVRPRLVVGADGRSSSVRRGAGIRLRRAEPTHLISGMLVEGMAGWPGDRYTLGTEGDLQFLIFPQPAGRLRLYACTGLEEARRWTGPHGPQRLLDAFAGLSCLPDAERFRSARPAGPCATFTAEDTWTDTPLAAGAALVGDAAGYNNPNIGQGLSLAVRDVRVLSEVLLGSTNWTVATLRPYAEERQERLRRQRRVAATYSALFSTFNAEARARRARFLDCARAGAEQAQLALRSIFVGPHRLPAEVFSDEFHRRVLG
jgi:2-polyprenyl-6-methoxyphenol hydroxylase-like FAD-dependent oxidoreductase